MTSDEIIKNPLYRLVTNTEFVIGVYKSCVVIKDIECLGNHNTINFPLHKDPKSQAESMRSIIKRAYERGKKDRSREIREILNIY